MGQSRQQPPTLIAGEVPLDEVMARLRRERPVFHFEADLQLSFARLLRKMEPEIQVRLEVLQPKQEGKGAEHLDLLCIGPSARTAIEFKYFTAQWSGTAGPDQEEYALKSHAATDLGRLGFISDIERLERFGDGRPEQNGLALLITNEQSLWCSPKPGGKPTRDRDFRIHEGRTLAGELLWGGGDYVPNTRTLRGAYPLGWQPYSQQEGARGEFRYLAVLTGPQTPTAPRKLSDPAGRIPRVTDHDDLIRRVRARAVREAAGLPPCVDRRAVADAEKRLGFALPRLLGRLYCEVANGGFGPEYKLFPLVGEGRTAVAEYGPGAGEAAAGYWPQGVLPIMDWGCAMYAAVDCLRPQAPVLLFEPNAVEDNWPDAWFQDAPSLADWLNGWLEGTGWWEEEVMLADDFAGLAPWPEAAARIAARR